MKSLFLLLILTQLSIQLPHPGLSPDLVPRTHITSPHSSSLQRRARQGSSRLRRWGTEGSGTIIDNDGLKYLIPVTFGSQTLDAELDTGSSDTWLIQTGFDCFHTFDIPTGQFETQEAESQCNFGGTYTPDASFTPIEGLQQLSCYGEGNEGTNRCVAGPVGETAVTLVGLTVPAQLVGAPNLSSFPAEGQAEQSGIIGLAFPVLSGISNATGNIPYPTIMDTFFEVETFTPPLAKQFSLALSRDASGTGNGGIFTLGGIPSLTDSYVNVSSDTFTSAPFELFPSQSTTEFSFYSILVDSFVLGGAAFDADLQVIIDSGAPVIQTSKATAETINAAWSPPPDSNGILACNAVLPQPFGIAVGGAIYYVDSADLLISNGDGTCSSLLLPCAPNSCLVGDPFLKNVLAVYDWQDAVMSFYPRMYYES